MRIHSNITTHDLSESLGYPLWLQVNHWQHDFPLQWCTFNADEVIEQGDFLFAPGLPLHLILTDSLRQSIPSKLLRISESLSAMQYQLLQAMQVSEEAQELALSGPFLFLLVVHQAQRLSLTREAFAKLVLQKRTELLRFCGLPSTSSLKRLVGRIDVRPMLMDDFVYLYRSLQNEEYRAKLRHVARLNTHQMVALRFYTGPFWLGFMTILEPEMSIWEQRQIRRMADDTAQMGATRVHFQGIDTYQALQALHDRLVDQQNQLLNANGGERLRLLVEQYQTNYGDYPKPPLPGNDVVVALDSWAALVEEGKTMRHCVSGYGRHVGERSLFIYQVLAPQRLTMALKRSGTLWQVSEVRGHCNSAASEEAMAVIKEWFVAVQ